MGCANSHYHNNAESSFDQQVMQQLLNFPKFDRDKHDLVSFVHDFYDIAFSLVDSGCSLDIGALKSVFATLFENNALIVYERVPTILRTNEDWNSFVVALIDEFHPHESVLAARHEFDHLAQGINETVESFRRRVEDLAPFAHPYSRRNRKLEIVNAFIRGLQQSIRRTLLNTDFCLDTLQIAFQHAQDIEKEYVHQDVDHLTHQVNAMSMKYSRESKELGEASSSKVLTVRKQDATTQKCYFSAVRTNLKIVRGYSFPCSSGTLIKMGGVNADVHLFGASSVLDLLILRGSGEQIKWNKDSEKLRIEESCVCTNHLDSLLLSWKKHKVFNRVRTKGLGCHLPNAIHVSTRNEVPVARRRLTKEEAVRIMNSTGVLVHVGAAVCNKHFKDLEENRLHTIEFQEFDDDLMDGDDDIESDFEAPSREESVDLIPKAEIIPETEHDEETERVKKLQELAQVFGLERVTSRKKFRGMDQAVQKKKVNAMIRLIEEICKVTAGENEWEEFRSLCLSKIGVVERDSKVSEIMNTIASALEQCPKRSLRNRILSLVTGTFSEREIIANTGCTAYDIRQSKLAARGGFEESTNVYHRIRVDREKLKYFVAFLALPEVTMCLPSIGRSVKLESGESVELAKVVRIFSYREVYRMYIRYYEKQAVDEGRATSANVNEFAKRNCLSFSTAYELMKVLAPIRRKRLECIDSFQSDCIQAFDYLNQYINELAKTGKIDQITRSDLLRRSRVASNFISYEQRVHMEKESNTINHCLRYLLSDPKKKEFASHCLKGSKGHTHEQICNQCLECTSVFDVFHELLKTTKSDAKQKKDKMLRIRVKRMIDQMIISKQDVESYRTHQIRTFASEIDRKEILESLQSNEALIVLDFSLKIIPTRSVEAQTQWFGKAGISYHMSYCVARIGNSYYYHSFGHAADDLKQDGLAVSAITDHVFRLLKNNGVKKVWLRSDNAGTYHCAGYLSTLFHLSKEIGIEILGYVYSEAQSGKGDADRAISHSKTKIRSHVDGKGNARFAREIVQALLSGTRLKATSVHEIAIKPRLISKSSFPGILSYGAFNFEADGIRARKYHGIGEGLLIEKKKMIKNEFSYVIGLEGGTEPNGFWKKLNDREDRAVDTEEIAEGDSNETQNQGIFACRDSLCIKQYLTLDGLRRHELFGQHKRRRNTESTIDSGVQMHSDAVQTDFAASRSVASDSLAMIGSSKAELPKQGWAMKSAAEKASPMTDIMKKEITDYFKRQRKDGKRALAREICIDVREMTDPSTGEYCFELIHCPKESQCQSLISTLLRDEPTKKSEESKSHKKARTTNQTDQSEEESDDNLPSTSNNTRASMRKPVKRKSSMRSPKSALANEKLPIFEDDEFADVMDEIDAMIDPIIE